METTLQLEPWLDLNPIVGDATRWTMSIGPDGEAYVAIALDDDRYPFDLDRLGSRDRPLQRYRIVVANREVEFESTLPCVSEVQPVPEGLLLVSPRAVLWAPGDAELNAEVVAWDGRMIRKFCIGDGIEDIQATRQGRIWVGYGDEGIFANFGWSGTEPSVWPLGGAGLVEWDSSGKRHYEYDGDDSVVCCYSLNVVSEADTWCHFPGYSSRYWLVHLHSHGIANAWELPVHGSDAFAVDGQFAFFSGGYDEERRYHLYRLAPGQPVEPVAELRFVDETGESLAAGIPTSNTTNDGDISTGRDGSMVLMAKNKVDRVDIARVLGELGIA